MGIHIGDAANVTPFRLFAILCLNYLIILIIFSKYKLVLKKYFADTFKFKDLDTAA